VTRLIDKERVILDRKTNHIHQLNETAARVWSLCDGRKTPSEIGWRLAQLFQVDAETAVPDVQRIVRAFERTGLLRQHVRGDE
jgi:pyrroloquinoline quinone biosynthesis protein D